VLPPNSSRMWAVHAVGGDGPLEELGVHVCVAWLRPLRTQVSTSCWWGGGGGAADPPSPMSRCSLPSGSTRLVLS